MTATHFSYFAVFLRELGDFKPRSATIGTVIVGRVSLENLIAESDKKVEAA